MPRYSIKAIVGPRYLSADMYRFHADGAIHARHIFDQLSGGAARVYLYDRGTLTDKYIPAR